jgi:hypothetical protein
MLLHDKARFFAKIPVNLPQSYVSNHIYHTSLLRAALGLVTGLTVGSLIPTALHVFDTIKVYGITDLYRNRIHDEPVALRGSFIVYGATLTVSIPFWWLLHLLNYRRWPAIVGPVSFLALVYSLGFDQYFISATGEYAIADDGGLILEDGEITLYGWKVISTHALASGAFGGLIGFVVWRTAYRMRPSQVD